MSDVMSVTKVIGHNVNYDKNVLASELYRLNKDYNSLLNKPSVCTMERTTNWCAIPTNSYYGGYKYPKLQELYAKLFGENFADAHDALTDIRATKKMLFRINRTRNY